jgi:hypothetical protein
LFCREVFVARPGLHGEPGMDLQRVRWIHDQEGLPLACYRACLTN